MAAKTAMCFCVMAYAPHFALVRVSSDEASAAAMHPK